MLSVAASPRGLAVSDFLAGGVSTTHTRSTQISLSSPLLSLSMFLSWILQAGYCKDMGYLRLGTGSVLSATSCVSRLVLQQR